MEYKKVVRVEIELEDGTIRRLTGEEAERWDQIVRGHGTFCYVHGLVIDPPLAWEEIKENK